MNNPDFLSVFIVGNPRSGKTLLQSLLGYHGDFAWFSQYYLKFRPFPMIGTLNKIYNLPILGNFLSIYGNNIILPHPVEMPKDYNMKLKRAGSLEEKDVRSSDKNKLREIFLKQLKYQNKKIFLTDEGRPSRILYFNKIFPKSKFIHVIRDGRNVIATLLRDRSSWYNNNLDLNSFYKSVPNELSKYLLRYKGTKNYILALVALRWKMAILELERQKEKLNPDSYLLIKYEDLVKDKIKIIDNCLDFLNLKWTKRLKKVVINKKIYNEDVWSSYFNLEQKGILNKLLKDLLVRYHYF